MLNDGSKSFENLFALFSQGYLSPESFRPIPIRKKEGAISTLSGGMSMSEEERAFRKEVLRMKNRMRFTRKNINEYVCDLLKDREKISTEEIPIKSKKDLIRVIYISIYAGNHANNYKIIRDNKEKRIKKLGYEFPAFEIIKK